MEKNVVIELAKVILSDKIPQKSTEIQGANQEEKLENLIEAIKIADKSAKAPHTFGK